MPSTVHHAGRSPEARKSLAGLLFGQHGVVLQVSLVAGPASGEVVLAPRGGEFNVAVWLHDCLLVNACFGYLGQGIRLAVHAKSASPLHRVG